MQTDDKILSHTISFLRFPLIAAIVLLHSNLSAVIINGTHPVNAGQYPVHEWLYHFISYELTGAAVPLFFFISGFLFFYRSSFSPLVYGKKIKRRVHSLLIPYLFWNLAVLVLFVLSQIYFSRISSGHTLPIAEFTFSDWLHLFWDYSDGNPICYQFWFIRDLMVVSLLSPVVFLCVRHIKCLAPFLSGVIWAFHLVPTVPGFSPISIFFFTFGAWFSIRNRNFAVIFEKYRLPLTALYAVLLLCNLLSRHFHADPPLLHECAIVTELMTATAWTARGIRCGSLQVNRFLAGSAFWIYATHLMPVALLLKCWLAFIRPLNEFTMIAGYMLIPTLTILFGTASYALSLRVAPRFTRIVTGRR